MRSQTNNADVHPAPELKKQKIEFHPAVAACNKNSKLNPTGIVRFDGRHYHDWARRDEDYLCRANILNPLSDHLFEVYSKKAGAAKELWDELKLMYVTGEQGSKVVMVKKYVEFEMVEGRSVVEQVQELNVIAGSLVLNGRRRSGFGLLRREAGSW